MERKYITKGDLEKMLKENIVPYNGGEAAEQYADNESFTKLINTFVDDVDWSSRQVPDNGHTYYIGQVNVDWGIKFVFNNGSFAYQPFIRAVTGTLRAYEYNESGVGKQKRDYPFNSKGYHFDVDWTTLTRDGVTTITSLEIDMDTKTIIPHHFKMNPDRESEWD